TRSTGADTGAAAADTLTITNGSGSWNVAIDAGDDHATIASKINAVSGGAAASIQGGDIQLLSTGIGSAKGFTVTSTGGLAAQLGFSETQSAQDAQYVVNGTLHSATTNSGVTGAIPGVTLSFGDVTSTTLTVAAGATTGTSPEDELLAATKKKITDFVSSYNAVLELVHQKTQGESRVTNPKNLGEYLAGPMARNNQFSGVAFSLRQQMGEEVSGLADGDNLLRDIGITSAFSAGGGGSNGKLVIDDAKLTAALKADPDRVKAVLTQSDGASTGAGLGDGFVRRTSELAFTLQGRIDVTESSLDTQIKSLQTSIDNATNRLEKRKLYYERMFSSLETRVGAMQSQQSWLSGQFNSMSG
ncbi:MAG: flagellar capping protein, partial [Thermoleophilia bacterium]|nr:flagellar capping protein [Thermoleophilia bacterium]